MRSWEKDRFPVTMKKKIKIGESPVSSKFYNEKSSPFLLKLSLYFDINESELKMNDIEYL